LSFSNLFPFPLKGHKKGVRDMKLQETEQELDEEREELEK
jgi:hypothetical protein